MRLDFYQIGDAIVGIEIEFDISTSDPKDLSRLISDEQVLLYKRECLPSEFFYDFSYYMLEAISHTTTQG